MKTPMTGAVALMDAAFDYAALQQQWLTLSATACGSSSFLRWPWIGNWLSHMPAHTTGYCVCVYHEETLVGLALLSLQMQRQHGIFKRRTLALHEYLAAGFNWMIEYNGVLGGCRSALVEQQVIAALLRSKIGWDEIRVSGVTGASAFLDHRFLASQGLSSRVISQSTALYIDLDKIRAAGGDFLASLTKKSRYKIRSYQKQLAPLGPIQVAQAQNVEEAQAYFYRLKVLHQHYWRSRGEPGSFSSQRWESFHSGVIRAGLLTGEVQLLKIGVGDLELGYLYSLVHNGHVYLIQSGYNYAAFAEAHPGYLSLVAAIEHNLHQGARRFDFLAGDTQYKRMLAQQEEPLYWVNIQKSQLKFKIEDGLRQIKRKILRQSADVSF